MLAARCHLMIVFLLGATSILAADGGPAWYEVRSGDHLSRIAGRFGTTVNSLRNDNSLTKDIIRPGQRLELSTPLTRTKAKDIDWLNPCRSKGRILEKFGPYERDKILMPRTGVLMAQDVGAPVLVPANGVLRFLSVMDGMGTLAIIAHGGGYHSVLGPLDPDTVPWQQGQCMLRGDILGAVAALPESEYPPHLHIELRQNSKAIPPDRLLK